MPVTEPWIQLERTRSRTRRVLYQTACSSREREHNTGMERQG